MGRIFIANDSGLATLLDPVADTLIARGHDVVRGPRDTPGQVKTYTVQERAALIDTADVAVFTGRHACPRDLMAGATRLRGLCTPVIGVESIDLDAANALGLIIGHGAVPGNIIGMAESTIMLMLMLFYDVETNIHRVAQGQWRRPGHNSHQFKGKTIGLIGFGRIASEVADRLIPFGVNIVTYSPRLKPEDTPAHVRSVDLNTLLDISDCVSILTGLSPETRHMIDADALARMKPTAYLVNTGRGAIIDEAALIATLRDRRIAGAALDTFVTEPLPADSALRNLDNAILTPHCVGHTVDGWDEFGVALVENIECILAGDLPVLCKNPEAEPAWRARLAALPPQ